MRGEKAITISDAGRKRLYKWARERSMSARLILRAKSRWQPQVYRDL